MPELKTFIIDEKWTVQYDPENNDRPVNLLRYGTFHSVFPSDNVTIAMFYQLLGKNSK